MKSILEKIQSLKKEAAEFLRANPGFAALAPAHAGQVIQGLGHAADNATWAIESVEKAVAEKLAKEQAEAAKLAPPPAEAPAPAAAPAPAPADEPAAAEAHAPEQFQGPE